MGAEEEEIVDDQDPDEVEPEGEEPEEEEEHPWGEPPPLLKKFMAVAKMAKELGWQLAAQVVAADEDPQAFDPDVLAWIVEEMEELQDEIEEACKLLQDPAEPEMPEMPYLLDPPGYPKGTRRYRPLTPAQLQHLLSRRGWMKSELKQVQVRGGTILYARPNPDPWAEEEQDGASAPSWQPAPLDGPVTYTRTVEASTVKAPPPATSHKQNPNQATPQEPPSQQDDDLEIDLVALYDAERPPVQSQVKAGPNKADRFQKKVKT
jgi:hypothetical protein